jgi:hypothetical protein
MNSVRGIVTVALLGASTACGASEEPGTRGAAGSPVIAVRGWNSYPASIVSGRLRLVDGCLLVGDSVAFWADGTSWDATTRSVTFDSADPVRVGDEFTGGGGHYALGNLRGLDGLDGEAVIECLTRTGAADAVIAWPAH